MFSRTTLSLGDVIRPGQDGPLDVSQIKRLNFSRLSLDDKVEIKERGRPLPDLFFSQEDVAHGKKFKRNFHRKYYDDNDWLCGCSDRNAVFCFPCMLVGSNGNNRCKLIHEGHTNLSSLSEVLRVHGRSKTHIRNDTAFLALKKKRISEFISVMHIEPLLQHIMKKSEKICIF